MTAACRCAADAACTACSLPIWTIFDSPDDAPGLHVARCFWVTRTSREPRPEPLGMICLSLGEARRAIHYAVRARGMQPVIMMPRDPSDDPSVVESWL